MSEVQININNKVRFRLTPEGRNRVNAKIYKLLSDTYGKTNPELEKHYNNLFIADDDGFCKMPLWEMMEWMGEFFVMGPPATIENNTLHVDLDS